MNCPTSFAEEASLCKARWADRAALISAAGRENRLAARDGNRFFLAPWLFVALVRNALVVLLLQAGAPAGYLAAALYMQDARGLYILTLPVLGAFNLSGLFSLGYDFTLERIEKLRTRRTLERYVSRNLVKEILENPASYYNSMRGVRKPATIPFLRYRRFHIDDRERRSGAARFAVERVSDAHGWRGV